jgi:hypothetical protein
MKIHQYIKSGFLAAAALVLASSAPIQAQVVTNFYINTFDTATQGAVGNEWGPGSAAWDGTVGNPPGSLLITAVFESSSDTPCVAWTCYGQYANPWYVQTPIDFSQFQTLQFDILWDNTSDITIGEFNDVSTWPFALTNSASGGQSVFYSWASGGGASLAAGGFFPGIEIDLCGGPGGQDAPYFANTNIPAAASNGWTHITLPINQAQAQIDGVSGIVFHKWCSDTWTLQTPVSARFWIDNVMLQGTTAPPPPPTLTPPVKAVEGLNIFASTSGGTDREEVLLVNSNGLSWVGNTSSGPVTYSFTIAGFPANVPTYSTEAYLFLVPNPTYATSAPDWNMTNCVVAFVETTATGAQMVLQYKVNEPGGNNMYYGAGAYTNAPGSWPGAGVIALTNWFESGNLTNVHGTNLLGAWTLQFTTDTNGTLIAPDGTTASFVIPSYYVTNFAETTGFNIYLGMQGNGALAVNQAVVYSSFALSNVPSAYSENFVGETTLNTNIWTASYASGPHGVLIVPPGAPYWISWSLPANGYVLTDSGSLAANASWNNVTTYTPIAMSGVNQQLLSTNDFPAGNAAFFQLVQRTFTQLQVLLPGQTNAPNTALGYTGSPTPYSWGASSGLLTATVLAVDAKWNPIPGVTDTIQISNNGGGVDPNNAALVNGSGQFTVYFMNQPANSVTITATDTTNTNVPPATSAAVTVGP